MGRRLYALLMAMLLLAACGGPDAAPTPQSPMVPLQRIVGGEVDGQRVTVVAAYYERGGSALLAPMLSLESVGGPTPLITGPSKAVALSKVPEGSFSELAGARYGVLQISGVVAEGEPRELTIESSKVISPTRVKLEVLQGGGFENVVVLVEGALLSKPGTLLLLEGIGPGGIPEDTADQIKVVAPIEDAALLAKLQGPPEGQIRYGRIEAVGIWSRNALQLLWARAIP